MKEQYFSLAKTLLKVFVGAFLAQVIATSVGVSQISMDGWTAAFNAGVSAVLIAAYNWIDPKDARYGVGYVASTDAGGVE